MLREIISRVWVGSEPDIRMMEQSGADAVLCTIKKGIAPEVKEKAFVYSEYPIPDGKVFRDDLFSQALDDLERWYDEGRTVLVHCRAGRNRSATTIALFLIRRGMPPQEAIDLIRAIRPRAIANPVFEAKLLEGGLG